ncbi:MAG: hypothetical protein ABIA11_02715 [Patescibacteria group bacterium]
MSLPKVNLRHLLIIFIICFLTVFLIRKSYYSKNLGVFFIQNPLFVGEFNLKDLVCSLPGREDTIDEKTESIFENLTILKESFSDEQLSSMQGFLEFRVRALKGINTDNWDWENDFAYAYIRQLDLVDSLIYLNIDIPDDQRFQSDSGVFVAKVSCALKSTATANNMNLELIEIGVDVFENVEPNKDAIFFKCLNDRCDEIGEECIIVKGVYVQ